ERRRDDSGGGAVDGRLRRADTYPEERAAAPSPGDHDHPEAGLVHAGGGAVRAGQTRADRPQRGACAAPPSRGVRAAARTGMEREAFRRAGSMIDPIDRPDIEHVYALIQPYVRKTPIVDVAGADLGLGLSRVVVKLELLQRAASFKTRWAFTNLLT